MSSVPRSGQLYEKIRKHAKENGKKFKMQFCTDYKWRHFKVFVDINGEIWEEYGQRDDCRNCVWEKIFERVCIDLDINISDCVEGDDETDEQHNNE